MTKLYRGRNMDILKTVPDTEYNRDLVAKYGRIQAILVADIGEPSDLRKAARVEKELWQMLVDESMRGKT